MTSELVVDDGLVLVEPPEHVPPVGPQPGALALAGPAADAPFLIEGERAAAAGPQKGPLERIVIGAGVVAGGLDAGGTPVNVVCTPGLVRRELVESGGGTRLETVLAAPTLPLVAAQWARPGRPSALTVSLTVLPEAVRVAYRTGRGCAVFANPGAPPGNEIGHSAGAPAGGAPTGGAAAREIVTVALSPAPRAWSVCPGPDGGARVTAQLEPSDTVTLLISAGPEHDVREAIAAARHLGAHARRAAEGAAEGLTLATGQADLDDAVPWARTRLRASLLRLHADGTRDPETREDVFWCGLGAAAAGDLQAAEQALALLEAAGSGCRAALLAARIALVFGRQTAAVRHAAKLMDAPSPPTGDSGSAALRSYALASLADALRYAAHESTIEELRAAARRPPSGGKHLPVVGGGTPSFAEWLGRALAGAASEDGRRTTGHRSMDAALTAWAAFRREPDVAWAAWGIHAARGLGGPGGPGTWDAPDPMLRASGRTAGALLAALAHGFLRLVPDAPVGRLGLGPCIGQGLGNFRVDGIVLGGALLRLDYEREGACHRFGLSAVGTRVPPVVAFDPLVPGHIRSVRIDGEPAELDLERVGPATRAPVQLSLDAARTVELFGVSLPSG